MKKYLKLIRVKHYIKNLLVFAALACSGKILETDKLFKALLAFAAFCATSSVVYVTNDIHDIEKDKLHPQKRNRPIASGAVSVKSAWISACVLFVIAIVCNILLSNVFASVLIVIYLILNLAYSFGLKDYPIIDITILSSGFVLRVIYGAVATDISISNWLYLTIFAISFFFAMGKRRNELRSIGTDTRKVLHKYPVAFLDKGMTMCMTLTNVFYALWTTDVNTIETYNNRYLIFTVPIVLLITLKYSLTVEGESDGDPIEVLFHDKILIVLCIIYLIAMFAILYLAKMLEI